MDPGRTCGAGLDMTPGKIPQPRYIRLWITESGPVCDCLLDSLIVVVLSLSDLLIIEFVRHVWSFDYS